MNNSIATQPAIGLPAGHAREDTMQIEYALDHGYIPAWLVAGPVDIPIEDLARFQPRQARVEAQLGRGVEGDEVRAAILRAYRQDPDAQLAALAASPPSEGATWTFEDAHAGSQSLVWKAARVGEDHYVNLTVFAHTWRYMAAWAYTKLVVPDTEVAHMPRQINEDAQGAASTRFVLTTNGPADVWLDGAHIHSQEHFSLQRPQSGQFQASLAPGTHDILVRFEVVAARATPFLLALHLDVDEEMRIENGARSVLNPDWSGPHATANKQSGPHATANKLRVALPTTLTPVARRQRLEQLFDQAYLKQSVFHGEERLEVFWPEEVNLQQQLAVRLQTPSGRIYAEGHPQRPGSTINLGSVYQVPDGDYEVVLLPPLEEYYERGMRISRRLPLRVSNAKYAASPADAPADFEARRQEALADAARRNLNIYSEIARMALGDWERIRPQVLQGALDKINAREDCADFELVGLLGARIRYGDHPSFPEVLRDPFTDCVLGFKYWMDEPGDDAMCFWTENHQILFHTCQVLAGQLFPDARFSNTGQTGAWHRAMGEQRAFSWLRKRAAGGFIEWDSNCYFCEDILALSHLADLAEDMELADLAAVVLDKLLFTMALNSFQGVFGSTHGRTYTSLLLDGRGERTSGISRFLWGEGALNDRILGTVGLACAQSYGFPNLIAAIAQDRPEEMWNRERHAGEKEAWCDLVSEPWEVNKVTYKTPDYMLCSAQDYRPGEPGVQQHIWQATLGADAIVFVNHPIVVADSNDHRPNFWTGNGALPRVAQWKDALICLYRLPPDEQSGPHATANMGLGWTHAYFPATRFDEYEIRDGWAFARKGDGYLALTAANGLTWLEQGPWAYRELRASGLSNSWVCQMGRAARDGSFADFIQANLAHAPVFDTEGAGVTQWQTLRGETLALGWEGPFWRNGQEEPITGFPHYDNPYCTVEYPAQEMNIRYQDVQLRLDFREVE